MILKVAQWLEEGMITGDAADELTNYLAALLANKYVSISAGGLHSCGLRVNGAAYCWGYGEDGQLGDGTDSWSKIPVKVLGGHTFASISAGFSHTCGVTPPTSRRDPGGVAYCWGENEYGQLGDQSLSEKYVPVKVFGGLTFAAISADLGDHTCGLTTAGKAYCWGRGFDGQLGNGGFGSSSTVPVAVSGGHTFASISAGGHHTCGITTAGEAYCWGDNTWGELGDGTNDSSDIPVAVSIPEGTTFASIDAGGLVTCGVTTAGMAYCWGRNLHGELGDGTNVDSNVPVAVSGGHTFASIDAGVTACGVTTAGVGYCWGENDMGQLGNGTYSDSNVPVAVAGGHTFASISGGHKHTCGVTTAGTGYCWGSNFQGQLGAGKNKNGTKPVPVAVASP